MSPAELTGAVWRKSSRSGSDSNCVEVAALAQGFAVRDSKDPDGPVLLFPHASWTAFLTDLRSDHFTV